MSDPILLAIYGLVAVCVGCMAWSLRPVPQVVPAVKLPKLARRLDLDSEQAEAAKKYGPITRMLLAAGRLIPQSWNQWDALRNQLAYTRSRFNMQAFLGIKVLAALAGMFIASVVMIELRFVHQLGLAVCSILGFLLPDWWLKSRVKRRQRSILQLLPDVIDLLALCVGAGLDFLGALNKVVRVKNFQGQALVEELEMVLQEIKLGKRRFESLKALAKRVDLAEVSSFVRTIVQADRMGTPISEVLAVHSEDVRFERFTKAERAASTAPLKILGPLIFCIMPCVVLVIAAPVVIQFQHINVWESIKK